MRQIVYGGGTFVTSDEIAEALLGYAAALGSAGQAATIHVPAVTADDRTGDVALLVGPASQLMAEQIVVDDPEPDGTVFLVTVQQRMAALEHRHHGTEPDSFVDWDI